MHLRLHLHRLMYKKLQSFLHFHRLKRKSWNCCFFPSSCTMARTKLFITPPTAAFFAPWQCNGLNYCIEMYCRGERLHLLKFQLSSPSLDRFEVCYDDRRTVCKIELIKDAIKEEPDGLEEEAAVSQSFFLRSVQRIYFWTSFGQMSIIQYSIFTILSISIDTNS